MSGRSANALQSAVTGSSPSSSTSTSTAISPVKLSAKRLHALARRAFRVGNRGRLSLCEAFRALSETRLYLDLGFPSLAAYADSFFQLRRAEAFEYVRVAKALAELTELREAFGRGRIGWSVLKAITRVATVSSQASWIDFVRRHGAERTLAEARDALRRGRDAPRESSFGLPNLDQKLVLRFSRSDMEKVRTWIEGACAEVGEKTGADDVSVEQAILFLCEKEMVSGAGPEPPVEGDCSGELKGSSPASGGRRWRGGAYRAQIVYQHCPECRKARMGTQEGFVEVGSEEVERYEGSAEPVVIDGPTPARLRHRILAREAGSCGNPRCHHRADHCHHIVFRSRGGSSDLANQVAVCTTCHALIHAGLLRVTGRGDGELRWLPVAAGDSVDRADVSGREVADRLPVLQLVAEPGPRASGGRAESADADSSLAATASGEGRAAADHGLNLGDLAQGLTRLGVGALRSKRMIGAAVKGLPPGELTEANVLRRAIASI